MTIYNNDCFDGFHVRRGQNWSKNIWPYIHRRPPRGPIHIDIAAIALILLGAEVKPAHRYGE